MNRYFHWCAGCWDWVCDCRHCVEPLKSKRHPVKDIQIRSVGYDRRRGRLEIEFTWTDDVRQFYAVAPAMYRQLLAAKPVFVLETNSRAARRSLPIRAHRSEASDHDGRIACELLYRFE
jgi:KTSC domain